MNTLRDAYVAGVKLASLEKLGVNLRDALRPGALPMPKTEPKPHWQQNISKVNSRRKDIVSGRGVNLDRLGLKNENSLRLGAKRSPFLGLSLSGKF